MIQKDTPGYLLVTDVDAHANSGGDTEVKIYSNGIWEVAPHPLDTFAASGTENSYNAGMFVSFRRVKVNRTDLPQR